MGWLTTKKPKNKVDAGFIKPTGTNYLKFLDALHTQTRPEWYLEIGTETGRSLALVRANAIAVDPHFRIETNLRCPSRLHMFQLTSDDFFATDFLERNDIRIDLAFLDGLHHFEYLLRDFMNTERRSKPESIILLHDCVPFNHIMAERDWDMAKTPAWTGDVWKLLPILKRYRPDLTIKVLDCKLTGLVMISGLNPASTALDEAYTSILAEWTHISLVQFTVEQLVTEFPLVAAEDGLATTIRR